jgi:threonine synthase
MRTGLAPDGGLYMPSVLPKLEPAFWSSLHELDFTEIALGMARPYLEDELPVQVLKNVVEDAFHFPLKMHSLTDQHHILELFHGPTLAFKDFGARFMARLFSEIAQQKQREVTILVATSGDTGSAVAHGFYKVPGVKVCLLYPKGKVSRLQEMQMATLGENVTALEVDGVFDDCQRLVKQAFIDKELNQKLQLSSANSINIARLLPQSFYYAYAWGVLKKRGFNNPVFSVPSGNFGNLTGGLLAMKMGMPVQTFLAATNVNDVVPEYLKGSEYIPKDSVQTLSNAMDVGNPSNFVRIKALFGGSDDPIRRHIKGFSYTDVETLDEIRAVKQQHNYLVCPHTAIGLRAAKEYSAKESAGVTLVTLATAHPVKFREVIEPETGQIIDVPERLAVWLKREKQSTPMGSGFDEFKGFLMETL